MNPVVVVVDAIPLMLDLVMLMVAQGWKVSLVE